MNPNGITYALIIAVENYNKPSLFKKVSYAAKDADDVKDALLSIGVDTENIKVLIDTDATHTAIITELKFLSNRVTKDDRIIFFFAGHGAFFDDTNWIIPVDAYKNSMKDTCIKISSILRYLKKSNTNRNIVFIDSCHSGFEPGEIIREIDSAFMADELKYHYKDEEYCCGFASSKSNQKSISDPKLQNGVWTHYLVKALKGEGGNIYEEGILFSDKLQDYLNRNVAEFVKMNTTDKKDQTPIMFGNLTNRFIIADLNTFFAEREKDQKVVDISFTSITLLNEEEGYIRSLPGFKKGYHNLPNDCYSGADDFVKNIGFTLIKEEIDDLGTTIKNDLNYKRRDIEASSEGGTGTIGTPDFTYSMEIAQSDKNPSEYVLIRKLEGFSKSQIILGDDMNSIFSNYFKKLEFELSDNVDVDQIIDIIEDMDEDRGIYVDYNPSDFDKCIITMDNLDYQIEVSSSKYTIVNNIKTNPRKLIMAFKETNRAILDNPELKMLNE